MMKVLMTGGNGLVGSRIVELLSDKFEFENLSRQSGVDIRDFKSLRTSFKKSNSSVVLNLAAKADVDSCESDKVMDLEILKKPEAERNWEEIDSAWAINVYGASNVVKAADETGKKLIHISTDFVFDGTSQFYTEESAPKPINWYGETKYEAEKFVLDNSKSFTIIRIAFPFRASFQRNDFFRAIWTRLKNGQEVSAVYDQIITPTFIDDLADNFEILLKAESSIYHATGGSFLSPFDASVKIAKTFGVSDRLISKISASQFFEGRARRPFKLALKNDKIRRLGAEFSSFEAALIQIKSQLNL